MAEKKKKPEKQNINITVHGNVTGSNLAAGNQNQLGINTNLSASQTPLPTYKKDSELHPAGDLPLGSHLPFSPNALFTGREKELKDLAENLLGESKTNTVITQAVTGMGGLGKTQLAIEFGYRYGKYFRGVHWINLADPSQLDSEIANCGRQMFSGDFPEDQPSQIALTLQTWKTNGPNLLILDNFEEPSIANDVLAKLRHSNIRILVTSRRTDWQPTLGLIQLPLDVLSPEESLQFLQDSLKNRKDTEEDLRNLAKRLGYLPLGLELASRYLSGHQRLSVSDYLQQTENALDHASMKNWQADMPAATKHDLDLQRTFALSWQEIQDETAQKIFITAGYLAPNTPIPLEIFEQALEISTEKCDEVLNLLYGLGLFRKSESRLPVIHPLLAEYTHQFDKEENQVLKVAANASAIYATKINEYGIPNNFVPLKSHILSMAIHCERLGLEDAGALLSNYGFHLNAIADFEDALSALERALEIAETNFGINDPRVATQLNSLAKIYYDLGDFNSASTRLERALKINEAIFGANHPNISSDVSGLGMVAQSLGDLKYAQTMFERALKIDETNFGKDHPDVARDVNNLGSVLKDLGDLNGAKEMLERALKIDEANFGKDHPNVARDVNNLGSVLQDLGDLNGAKEMFERALKIFENNLGTDHPNIATLINNLGSVLQDLGDLNGAKEMLERALKIFENNLGTDHPNIATLINNLGSVLQNLGDLKGAKDMYERALKIDEVSFGKDHPNVARDANNLGLMMKKLGDLHGAKAMYERALKIDEANFGADHPNVAIRFNNLGMVMKDLGDLNGAKVMLERALEIFKKFLPTDHPNIKIVQDNLDILNKSK